MKKIIILLSFALISTGSKAQTAPMPEHKTFVLDTPKDEGTLTTNRATLKGKVYEVYANRKGRLFINLCSPKTGKAYKRYIPETL